MTEEDTQCTACNNRVSKRFRYCGYCGCELNIGSFVDTASNIPSEVAERRQLTVLFCDLCNSILFTQLLDQEDMRSLIRRYQTLCKVICEQHGGYISRYIGDGIVVFFGYPNPLEEAAERAVAAGLEIVAQIEKLKLEQEFHLPEPVQIRVGIATGEVVIGDAIGEGASRQHIAVGLAPNLAARLQEYTEPNTVLISDSTNQLLGSGFNCSDMGLQSFKSMLDPVHCWLASIRSEVLHRFENRKTSEESKFLGRSEELELLNGLWSDVLRGHGRTVLVHGDAGIGKSRLLRELMQQLSDSHQHLVFQCVATRKNTALHPFTDMSSQFVIQSSGSSSSELQAEVALNFDVRIPSEVNSGGDKATKKSVQSKRISNKPLAIGSADNIYEQILASIADKPSVMLVEDVQWSDNSSLDVIGRLSESGAPLLLVFTSRSLMPQLDSLVAKHTVSMKLKELSADAQNQLLDSLVGEQEIPDQVKNEIIYRSGGTPFYLEQITKAALTQLKSGSTTGPFNNSIVIPADIKDALFTRLGDDPLTRSVVQYASVMGSKFSTTQLNRLLPSMVKNIDQRIDTLVSKGVFTVDETSGTYGFSHSLLRETAYDSLLNSDKRRAHLLLAKMYTDGSLRSEYDDLEIIARHYTHGGVFEEAVNYWIDAGRSAAKLSANVEASSHFKKGLELYKQPGAAKLTAEKELELQLGLASSLTFTEGPGSLKVKNAYSRAIELCTSSTKSDLHFKAYWGWWRISYNFETHKERANDLLVLAEELEKPELVMQAHHCQWATLFNLGQIRSCCTHVAKGLYLYEPDEHLAGASIFGGHDAKVCALGERALSEWLMGSVDTAFTSIEQSLDWAEKSKHAGSIAHALDISLMLHAYHEEYSGMVELSSQLIDLANEHSSPDHLAKGFIYKGWANANMGNIATGFEDFIEGMNLQVKIGTREDSAVFDCMRAIFLMRNSQYFDAIELLTNSLKEAEQTGIIYYNSELIRLRALANYLTGEYIHVQILQEFDRAINIANEFGMKSLELRAMHSGIAMEAKTNEVSELRIKKCHALLSSFTEGQNARLILRTAKLMKEHT